jgi:hypothetical protein
MGIELTVTDVTGSAYANASNDWETVARLGFDGLLQSTTTAGVYWLRQGERRRAGDSRGDGRNPRKTTNANDERFALAA